MAGHSRYLALLLAVPPSLRPALATTTTTAPGTEPAPASPCDDSETGQPRCLNDATCTVVGTTGFNCTCPWGYWGELCEESTYWTLQQWQSNECGGVPWRCFRLKMGECIDTGFTDGNIPTRKNWFGRLDHVDVNGGLYSIRLCWGEGEEEGSTDEDKCVCSYNFQNIRRLGKNSLGPPTEGRESPDSDRCHKLMRITSSRLINSTGNISGDLENVLCEDPDSARRSGFFLATVLSLLPAFFQ